MDITGWALIPLEIVVSKSIESIYLYHRKNPKKTKQI